MIAEQFLTKNLVSDHTRLNDQIPRPVLCCQMNEKITKDIVYDILKANKRKYPKITIKEQQSENPRVKKLKHASNLLKAEMT